MAKKSEAVSTNPMKLNWPTDYNGICQKLQREGCRSIGRMGGDEKQFEIVMETLRILAGHAKAKLEDQRAVSAVTVGELAKVRERHDGIRIASLGRQEKALEGQIAGLGARLAGLQARAK